MFETQASAPKKQNSRRRGFFGVTTWLLLGVAAVLAGVSAVGARAISLERKLYPDKPLLHIIRDFGQLAVGADRPLVGQDQGVINILLLAVGGNGQWGDTVTDTMMIASVKLPRAAGEAAQVALYSIPRDLKVSLPDTPVPQKINAAYEHAEWYHPGSGPEAARQIVKQVTGIDCPYYAVVDLDGFRQAVDAVGGVDVDIPRAFTDTEYPDYHYGIQTVHFDAGQQHLDGERALEYARSRKGNNGEGTDFRRVRRQQQVLQRLKDRVAALNNFSDLGKINALLEQLATHFKTNLEPWEMLRLYQLTRQVPDQNILPLTLDPSTGLVCSTVDADTKLYFLTLCPGKTEQDILDFSTRRFELGAKLKQNS